MWRLTRRETSEVSEIEVFSVWTPHNPGDHITHTALQLVGSCGLDKAGVGLTQAVQPPLVEVVVGPPLIGWKPLAITAMPLQQQTSQATSDQLIILAEDAPVTVSEVRMPSSQVSIETLDGCLQ